MAAKVINRYRLSTGEFKVTFYANAEKLLDVVFNDSRKTDLEGVFLTKSNKVIDEAIGQFMEFVRGERKKFELPLDESVKNLDKEAKALLKK